MVVELTKVIMKMVRHIFSVYSRTENRHISYDKDKDGNITESPIRTGLWAWKHPHSDGTITYTELKGDIVLMR